MNLTVRRIGQLWAFFFRPVKMHNSKSFDSERTTIGRQMAHIDFIEGVFIFGKIILAKLSYFLKPMV